MKTQPLSTADTPETPAQNRLRRALARLERLPEFAQAALRRRLLGWHIPFTGTAGLDYPVLDPDLVRVRLANRRRVRNHIRGVHAAAAALLAETASGLALGMHLPDDKVPLLKTMAFRYTRRAAGGLTAEAVLAPEQIRDIETLERGEVKVAVNVWDDDNEKPLECVIVWAWRTKAAKP